VFYLKTVINESSLKDTVMILHPWIGIESIQVVRENNEVLHVLGIHSPSNYTTTVECFDSEIKTPYLSEEDRELVADMWRCINGSSVFKFYLNTAGISDRSITISISTEPDQYVTERWVFMQLAEILASSLSAHTSLRLEILTKQITNA